MVGVGSSGADSCRVRDSYRPGRVKYQPRPQAVGQSGDDANHHSSNFADDVSPEHGSAADVSPEHGSADDVNPEHGSADKGSVNHIATIYRGFHYIASSGDDHNRCSCPSDLAQSERTGRHYPPHIYCLRCVDSGVVLRLLGLE